MDNGKEYEKSDKESLLSILSETEKLANVGGWEWDIGNDVWSFSDNWLRMHGCSKRHLTTPELLPIAHPDDRADIQKTFDKAISEGSRYEIEHRIIHQVSGEIRYIRVCGAAKPDKNGVPWKMYGSAQDITNQKHTEQALQKEQTLFKTIVDRLPLMITRYDPDAKMLFLNNEFEKCIGWTTEEARDINIMEKVYPDPAYREQAFEYMQKAGREWRTFHVRAKSGKIIESEWSNIRLQDGTQIGIGIDISERKKIEESLRKNESLFRGLYDNMTSGSAIYEVVNDGSKGSDYIVKNFNKKSLEIEGKTLDQVVGKSLFELRPNIDDYGLIPAMKKVWETGEPDYYPMKIYQDEKFSNYYENYLFKIPTGEVVTVYNDVTDRKNIEEALKESEERYRSLFENVNEAVYLHRISPDGEPWKFEQVNPAACKMLGYTKEEFQQMSPWELDDPETSKHLIPRVMDSLRGYGKAEFEAVQIARDGGKVDVDVNTVMVPVQGKKYIVSVCRDITERKRIEKELRLHESIVSSALEPMAVIDKEYRYLFVNSSYATFWDIRPKELTGKYVFDIIGSDVFEKYVKPMVDKCLAGENVTYTSWFQSPVLGKRFISLNYHPHYNNNGDLIGLINIAYDITDQKRNQTELQAQKNLLEGVLDSIEDIIGVQLPDHTMLQYNRAGYELLGVTEEQVKGRKCYELLGRTSPCEPCATSVVYISKKKETLEKYVPELEGHFICTSNPVLDDDGNIKLIIEQLRNITEKKKMDEKIQQSQKMEAIGNLAGGIAHDFNNLLFPIVGMSEMLMEDLPKGSPEHKNVKIIYNSGIRGKDLVKQILAFGRQSDQNLIPVQVQRILKEVFKLVRTTIPANIEIQQNIQKDCGMVMADPTQLHQVVMNLVTNAFHAVEKSGEAISVKLKETVLKEDDILTLGLEPGSYAQLTVSDKGYGIDPSSMSKIFDPYFTTKEKEKGTGLGLSVVHGIIKKYKGDITVDSELGKGTDFNIYLPIVEQTVTDRSHELSETLPKGTEHILLVDDEKLIVQTEKQILEKLGYRVTFRSSSPEALEAFKADPGNFDLVITDMSMPQMTGEELSRTVMEINPDIPVIICTGFSEMFNEKKAEAIGIKAFLMKPLVAEDLARTVREVLDAPKAYM